MHIDICCGTVIRMAQDFLQGLRSHSLFSCPAGIGVPGAMRVFLRNAQFLQQRVVIPFSVVFRAVLSGISRQEQRSGCLLGEIGKIAAPF